MDIQHGILVAPPQPRWEPLIPQESPESSSLSLSIIEGPNLSVWSIATATEGDTDGELKLELQPDQTVVIGRQEGGRIEYLDSRYQPTQLLPNSSQRVVGHLELDMCVSRGHFMLNGSAHGISLVNGVPRRGGGIRPPKNGTVMLEPEHRSMIDGEDYMIERGASATIRLPNGTVILLRAE
jgi:hypothetical protein